MFLLYSLLLTIGFIVLLPRFLFDAATGGKWASGFWQRLGFLPDFKQDEPVIWLHCVSVGEANAARPLVKEIKENFPGHSLIVSTTTKTGQKLAKEIFEGKAEAIFYFPFDFKFSVRRALRKFNPNVVLLMETEIWFNFIREAHKSGARLVIVNGRLSEKSFKRYSYIKKFMRRVLTYLDLALMQGNSDATRLMSLGMRGNRVKVTGNIKFDQECEESESDLIRSFRERFGISADAPLIIAASTHAGEEKWILEAFVSVSKDRPLNRPRLLIAPRHPERFDEVEKLIEESGLAFARRSEIESESDKTVDIILLDSIGELRAVYPLAEIVFVGGSLIPHGGQSILEPAAAGKAIVTGPYTHNFDAVVKEFLVNKALVQLPEEPSAERLYEVFSELLQDENRRHELGRNAAAVMEANRGATSRTIKLLAEEMSGKRKKTYL